LKVLWFATGVDDALMPATKSTVDLLKRHGFAPVLKESPGGHTREPRRPHVAQLAQLPDRARATAL